MKRITIQVLTFNQISNHLDIKKNLIKNHNIIY